MRIVVIINQPVRVPDWVPSMLSTWAAASSESSRSCSCLGTIAALGIPEALGGVNANVCTSTPSLPTRQRRWNTAFRDLHMESCAFAGLTFEPNASSMRINCGLSDRHPKTCPALFAVRHKGFKNPTPEYFGYARTVVRNGHLHERAQIPNLNGNRSLLAERFFCILNNIRKASRETALIERQIVNFFSGQ